MYGVRLVAYPSPLQVTLKALVISVQLKQEVQTGQNREVQQSLGECGLNILSVCWMPQNIQLDKKRWNATTTPELRVMTSLTLNVFMPRHYFASR